MGEGAQIPAGSGGSTALLQIDTAFVQGRDTPSITTNELISMVPHSWFSTKAKRYGGVFWTLMSSIGLMLANIKDVIILLKNEFRIATAHGSTLDVISLDFFGANKRLRLPRHRKETDDSFRARIKSTLLRPHGTITGIKQSVKEVTGAAPIVVENLNLNDYDSWTGVVQWDDTNKRFYVVPYMPFTAEKSFMPISLYNQTVMGSTSILAFQELSGLPGNTIFNVPGESSLPLSTLGPLVWWFRGDELFNDYGIGGGIDIWRNIAPNINQAAPFQFRWTGVGTRPTVQRNSRFAPCASFPPLGNLSWTTSSGPGGISADEWTLYMVIQSTVWPAPIFTPGNAVQSFLSTSVVGGRAGTMLLGNWYDGANAFPNTEGMLLDYYPGGGAAQEFTDVVVKMPAGFPFLVVVRSKYNGTTVGGRPQADVAVNVNGTGFLNFQRDMLRIATPILGTTAGPNVANFELWEMLRFDVAHSDEQMESVWEYLIEEHLVADGVPVPAAAPNLGTQAWGAKELGAPYEFWVFAFQNPLEAPDDAILDAIDRAKPIATLEHVFIIR